MHLDAQRFLCVQRAIFPHYFKKQSVIDLGSASICGTNRYLFSGCDYIGVDVMKYKGVDCVCEARNVHFRANTVISTEMLEHSETATEDLKNAIEIARNCLIITCAIDPRKRHGTSDTSTGGSPFKGIDYYGNIDEIEFWDIVGEKFVWFDLFFHKDIGDLYFIGFKHTPKANPNRLTFIYLFTVRFILNRLHDYKEFFKRCFRVG